MAVAKKVKVGTKFVEAGKVYRVFKIETTTANVRILHYRPYYKDSTNTTVVCSVPEKNLGRANIRFPVSKARLSEIMSELSKKPNGEVATDVINSKTELGLNDIQKSADVLRCFWCERQMQEEEMKKSKRDVMELAIMKIVEEVALVNKLTLEKARANILSALER